MHIRRVKRIVESKEELSENHEYLTCPFCLNQCIYAEPGKTQCSVRIAAFEIDDRVECVFADTEHIRLPVNGIICGSCGLVLGVNRNSCLYCGIGINRAVHWKFKMSKSSIIRFGLLTRLFQDLRLLIPLIKDYWKGTYRDISVKSIVIFVVALAYIISPIDLIPDYIIGLGQIDDAVILGLSLYFLEKDLRKYKEWKDRNE